MLHFSRCVIRHNVMHNSKACSLMRFGKCFPPWDQHPYIHVEHLCSSGKFFLPIHGKISVKGSYVVTFLHLSVLDLENSLAHFWSPFCVLHTVPAVEKRGGYIWIEKGKGQRSGFAGIQLLHPLGLDIWLNVLLSPS